MRTFQNFPAKYQQLFKETECCRFCRSGERVKLAWSAFCTDSGWWAGAMVHSIKGYVKIKEIGCRREVGCASYVWLSTQCTNSVGRSQTHRTSALPIQRTIRSPKCKPATAAQTDDLWRSGSFGKVSLVKNKDERLFCMKTVQLSLKPAYESQQSTSGKNARQASRAAL